LFVLPQEKTGRFDTDGVAETSCVVGEIGARVKLADVREAPADWARLNEDNQVLFRCLIQAIKKHGKPAASLALPAPMGAMACSIADWQEVVLELQVGHAEITPRLKERIRKQIQRACVRWDKDFEKVRILGKHKEFVWRTDRRVAGVDPLPSRAPEPEPVLARGETVDDLYFNR